MLPRRRQLAILLATVVALRALVPLGYMLESGSERLLDLALTLCPQQNPALDLSRLDAHAGQHDHHGHHGHALSGSGTDEAPLAEAATGIDNTCQLWSGGATGIVLAHATPTLPVVSASHARQYGYGLPLLRLQRVAAARAPPTTLIA